MVYLISIDMAATIVYQQRILFLHEVIGRIVMVIIVIKNIRVYYINSR